MVQEVYVDIGLHWGLGEVADTFQDAFGEASWRR